MSDIALSVRGLTKEYQILHNAERHDRVTDAVANSVKSVFRKKEIETFRALDDVSFDVKKGEVLGVIGRNGAGKSTLLKILSRITEPTSGEVHLFGRVGSLLEVGTGFHPELTGSENIFLNGAILGMKKREIERQFDAIVDFAEVEKFLDTPVKRYSSGMYVRLAFAVAAHLNPEILIVDEVLAVGDAQFQKKCLGKMQDVSRQDGRTVLFVSHNMPVIKSLCHRTLLLVEGGVNAIGETSEVLLSYLHSHESQSVSGIPNKQSGVTLQKLTFEDLDGHQAKSLEAFADYRLRLRLDLDVPQDRIGVAIWVKDEDDQVISCICNPEEGLGWFRAKNSIEIEYLLPDLSLLPRRYWITIDVNGTGRTVTFERVYSIEVLPTLVHESQCSYRSLHGILRVARGGVVRTDGQIASNPLPLRS